MSLGQLRQARCGRPGWPRPPGIQEQHAATGRPGTWPVAPRNETPVPPARLGMPVSPLPSVVAGPLAAPWSHRRNDRNPQWEATGAAPTSGEMRFLDAEQQGRCHPPAVALGRDGTRTRWSAPTNFHGRSVHSSKGNGCSSITGRPSLGRPVPRCGRSLTSSSFPVAPPGPSPPGPLRPYSRRHTPPPPRMDAWTTGRGRSRGEDSVI